MAAHERQTASYAAIPYATLTDRAASATRQRREDAALDRQIASDVSASVAETPEKWQCARATDLVGEGARIRSARTRRIDPR